VSTTCHPTQHLNGDRAKSLATAAISAAALASADDLITTVTEKIVYIDVACRPHPTFVTGD
jgi:hypothetical protein